MTPFTRSIRLVGWCCAAILIALLAILLTVAKPKAVAAPGDSAGTVGGLEYRAVLGRPVDPANPVDARIVKGLAPRDRHLPKRDVLLGAFVSVTNPSHRPLTSAARIDLRDDAMHLYRPLSLPDANRFAYRPVRLAAGATVPRQRTPAADDLAAGGRLLLYPVPAWQYRNGTFELVVHDPARPASTRRVVF
jgi:hypothetical protein